jgi:hypothetical protein
MSFYRWCMRSGAAILFVIACVQLLIGLLTFIQFLTTPQGGVPTYNLGAADPPYHFLLLLQMLASAFTTAALPFFGALVINRFDQWLHDRKQAEPFE